MLAVGIQLQRTVIAVFGGVDQAGLKCTGQAQIGGQVDQMIALAAADGTIRTKPMPMLKTRYISSWSTFPWRSMNLKIVGTSHAVRSISQAT